MIRYAYFIGRPDPEVLEPMARTHNDSWDPARGVGATATGAAMARALASRGPRPLIDDPFADPLVRAVGLEPFASALREYSDTKVGFDIPALGAPGMRELIGVQTRFFDQFFADACHGGIRQIVIVASGLDARGYRTAWPTGTTVFEIDQPAVLEFKSRTLADLGAAPESPHNPREFAGEDTGLGERHEAILDRLGRAIQANSRVKSA